MRTESAWKGWAFVLVGSIFTQSQAIVRLDGTQDSSYLSLGATHPEMGRLYFTAPDQRGATLITNQWMVTAGHNYINPTYAMQVTIGGQTYTTVKWIRHPKYNSSDLTSGNDISVCQLDRPVTGVTPAVLYTGSSEDQTPCVICGFGASGVGSVGQQFNDFTLRGCTNIAEMWSSYPNLIWTDFDNGTSPNNTLSPYTGSSASPTSLEGQVGNGDSGGGLFITVSGTTYLAGVTSFNGRFDSNTNAAIYGSISGFGRVSDPQVYTFIVNTISNPSAVFMSGAIKLPGWSASPAGIPVKVDLYAAGTSTLLESNTTSLNAVGGFGFQTALRSTTCDVYIKASHWLRTKVYNVAIDANGYAWIFATTPANGDVDGNNTVNIIDYAALSDAFNSVAGDARYVYNADLDGNGIINILDYAILSDNLGKSGL